MTYNPSPHLLNLMNTPIQYILAFLNQTHVSLVNLLNKALNIELYNNK